MNVELSVAIGDAIKNCSWSHKNYYPLLHQYFFEFNRITIKNIKINPACYAVYFSCIIVLPKPPVSFYRRKILRIIMSYPQRILIKFTAKITLIKIYRSINDGLYVISGFNSLQPVFYTLPHELWRHTKEFLNIKNRWQIPALQVYIFNKIICLRPSIFSGKKIMISASWNVCFKSLLPVSFKLFISIDKTLGCFYKNKTNLYILHFHFFHCGPVNILLIKT